MLTNTFPHTDLQVSRLGFGCASLMRVTSAQDRTRLLEEAFEHGLRHYDVARLYGLGAAEGELGRFARGRRDQLTIATKFGIEPAAGLGSLARFQQPARALLNRVPPLRKAIKRRHESLYAPRRYDASIAKRSLDTSLQELGVDYVDILFVHDCGPQDEVHSAELIEFFESAKAQGKLRAWGVSQDAWPGLDVVGSLGDSAVLQIRETILDRVPRSTPHLSFGVLGQVHGRVTQALTADPRLHADWADQLTFDPLSGDKLAWLLIAEALDANGSGAVLFSTIRRAKVSVAADARDNPPNPATMSAFRDLTRAARAVLA